MAELKHNVVTHGASGKVGDLIVFSQRNGKTIISKVPKKRTIKSEEVKKVNEKFILASAYAKNAVFQLHIKARYQQKAKPGQSAYNLALADYFTTPEIEFIDCSFYRGEAGDSIRIQVKEVGVIDYVKVSITIADGLLVEEGLAIGKEQSEEWTYKTTQKNISFAGSIIVIMIANLAGNSSSRQEIITAI
ncbi:MAG: hypothetical protein QM731_01585 [Chitinophagaceae bacterium]